MERVQDSVRVPFVIRFVTSVYFPLYKQQLAAFPTFFVKGRKFKNANRSTFSFLFFVPVDFGKRDSLEFDKLFAFSGRRDLKQ